MADIVSGVATSVLEKLATKGFQEIVRAWGLKGDVERLQDTMRIISAFLMDAENKQVENQSITEWLQQLKVEFHDASDVLDEMECEALRNQVVQSYGSAAMKVSRLFSCSNPLAFRFKMAHRVKGIKEKIDSLASLGERFGLTKLEQHLQPLKHNMSGRETHSYIETSHAIGRVEEKNEIIMQLMSPQAHDDEIDVIPIVGIGGLGKTTLAKLVYNDERVIRHFQLCMWVCVSNDFDVKRIALEILKAVGRTEKDTCSFSFDHLQSLLREVLHKKKFLLFLDDTWNEDRTRWLELRHLLFGEKNKNDSKIIVTTRNDRVAKIMGTVPQHNLRGLSEEESLNLFVKCAFRAGEQKQHRSLMEIGKEIVKKCRGVPLAVVSLGSLLYSKLDESEWRKIRDSEIWRMEKQDHHYGSGILPALRLSYDHLPPQLKQCFSYCSASPKAYEYTNYELIAFWMAHGLLQSTNENQEPEDLGELYIKELMSRFFFQDFSELYGDFIYMFKMHDLVHDLAMYMMQSEQAVVTSGSMGVNENARLLSFSDTREGVPNYFHKSKKVRTIGFWHATQEGSKITKSIVQWISTEFSYLRVLNLQGLKLQTLPDCFSKMKHLRYLGLAKCYVMEKLPDSICELQSLQFLGLGECRALQRLPKNTRNLVSLRVLVLTTRATDLSHSNIGSFKSLHTVTLWGCENLVSLPHDLRHLTALKRLIIRECKELVSVEDQEDEEEKEAKDNLSLELFIVIASPKLATLPGWLKRSAKTLQYMGLSECTSLTKLPGWLSNMKSLETLIILDCPKLQSLPQYMDGLHNLQILWINGCPQLEARLKQNKGLDWPKIACVPIVKVKREMLHARDYPFTYFTYWYMDHR